MEPDLMQPGPSWIGGGEGFTEFLKGHVCKKIKDESFGSNPWANCERFFGLGSFDMKDTLPMSCPVL
jgi:hypothetical protein